MSFGKAKDHLTRAEVHKIVSVQLGEYGAGYSYDITVERSGEVTGITTGRELRAKAKMNDKATVKVYARSKKERGELLDTVEFVFERKAMYKNDINAGELERIGERFNFDRMGRFNIEYKVDKPTPLPDPGVVIVPDPVGADPRKTGSRYAFDVFCDGRHASTITKEETGNWTVSGLKGSYDYSFRAVFAALSCARFSV